jgi:hypothetical protein
LLRIKYSANFSQGRVGQCIDQLRKHTRASHLQQYISLVELLITAGAEEEGAQVSGLTVELFAVEEELGRLRRGEIDYQ